MPDFDYRSMLVRYIGRVQCQEGVSHFDRTDFTVEEAAEVSTLVDEAERLWDWSGPPSPRTDDDMWIDSPTMGQP